MATVTRAQALCAAQDAMNKLLQAAGVTCGPDGKPMDMEAVRRKEAEERKLKELREFAKEALTAANEALTEDSIVQATAAVQAYSTAPGALPGNIDILKRTLGTIIKKQQEELAKAAEYKSAIEKFNKLYEEAEQLFEKAQRSNKKGTLTEKERDAAEAAIKAGVTASNRLPQKYKNQIELLQTLLEDIPQEYPGDAAASKDKKAAAEFTVFRHNDVNHSVPKNIDIALKAVQNSKTRQELSDNEKLAQIEIGNYATTDKTEADKLYPVLSSIVEAKNKEFDDAEDAAAEAARLKAVAEAEAAAEAGAKEQERLDKEAARLLSVARGLLVKVTELKDIDTVNAAADEAHAFATTNNMNQDDIDDLRQQIAQKEKELEAAANAKAAANANAKAAAAAPLNAVNRLRKESSVQRLSKSAFEKELDKINKMTRGRSAFVAARLRDDLENDTIIGLTEDDKQKLRTALDAKIASLDLKSGGARRTRRNKQKARRTTRRS